MDCHEEIDLIFFSYSSSENEMQSNQPSNLTVEGFQNCFSQLRAEITLLELEKLDGPSHIAGEEKLRLAISWNWSNRPSSEHRSVEH